MVHTYTHTHTLRKNIPACDFGRSFEAIVKVMWFKREGSKYRNRNSGLQKEKHSKTCIHSTAASAVRPSIA